MEETKELITTDDIRSKVYIIRGQQVMLDQDLAEIYGYQVKNLNQQVKRNLTRFYVSTNNSDYLQKARKYGHFTGYKN